MTSEAKAREKIDLKQLSLSDAFRVAAQWMS